MEKKAVSLLSELILDYTFERKSRIWRYIQSYWLTHADKAHEAVRTFNNARKGDLYCTALVEDGLFERNIMYPIALYSEMLWNPNGDTKEMMSEVGLRSYVTFA